LIKPRLFGRLDKNEEKNGQKKKAGQAELALKKSQ